MLDEYSYYVFYDERLPADVFDAESLIRWLRADPLHRAMLRMTREDFIPVDERTETSDGFPSMLVVGKLQLPVTYNFSPSAEDDGVTIRVPVQAVNQLTAEQIGWLVPGLIEEKIVALIRSLPKPLRRNFVPVPDTARQLATELTFGEGDLLEILARRLSQIAGEVIRPADFKLDKLPAHLRMNIQVVDEQGEPRAMGRELLELCRMARPRAERPAADSAAAMDDIQWHRDHVVSWDFDSLPAEISIDRGGIQIAAYPTLIDRGDAVDLRLLDTPAEAERLTALVLRGCTP